MCGIIGYSGPKQPLPILLDGLSRLEYRGYDSAGIAITDGQNLTIEKKEGKLQVLKNHLLNKEINGNIGIGHTRWATHGVPSDENAHPHYDRDKDFAIIHNGIIENYAEMKEELQRDNYQFESETDTEVVAVELSNQWTGNLLETVCKVAKELVGTYALVVTTTKQPDTIVAGRMMSPLVLGVGEGEVFLASDSAAILEHTNKMIFLENGDFVEIKDGSYQLFDINMNKISREIQEIDWKVSEAEKSGHDHFMYKEILEQAEVIERTITGRLEIGSEEIPVNLNMAKQFEKIWIVACGTAYHAGLFGKDLFEKVLGVPVSVELASEFRYREPIVGENDLGIVISQSGETMDTIAATELLKENDAHVLALVNVVGSSLARMADSVLYLHVGPEIGVASTKAYLGMLVGQLLLAKHWDESENLETTFDEIKQLPLLIKETLKCESQIKEISKSINEKKDIYFIGRGLDYALAAEGALKLKEISYLHAEALAAGELKHGTLALIENGTPVIVTASQHHLLDKTTSNVQEVKARGAYVIAIGDNSSKKLQDISNDYVTLPEASEMLSTIVSIIPLQFIAYHVANLNGESIDQPRNLAKSVTVE
ncbi:glutamine--fructose-6-phosphate transaminase (isomerizing) [Acidimicrobiaceae bacterium]|jgi:glucosamine--fructose-6-phosphate aminotransferase (isomerizing)|nr:glutamine--fructose-6-phosphate transaminase (isomerizing) [Acidimicrobiia bacterium]MDA7850520.1 glutamine--fructose-6-phosphate transaminase (isomerizing) [Acidimicrobiaceae bacterium]MDA8552661.1 glutamine--fructose-6-phosphate transaminase (isomerizing) [bacterium]MDB2368282.1 glutamine--fructose-6-phosphate transaminase (isomerizing) [Candidatus Actinomarina sp.]MDA8564492.1 glutamine--fructose-6-phosphate transaminase (isomerizing) [bacterium]